MLTKRQIEIIKELNDKDKLTAQNLASSLHVSTKTIRNDIHAINAMYPIVLKLCRLQVLN